MLVSAPLVEVNMLRAAVFPGVIAGVVSIFASWLWMAVVFHRYQRETPNSWRQEGTRSYVAASLLHVFAAIGVASLVTLVVRFHVASFGEGIVGNLRFALCVWAAIGLPIILEPAVFVRLHLFVVLGQLLDWLTLSILTCLITGWWLTR